MMSRPTEIIGQAILDNIAAMGREVRPILARHGMDQFEPHAWYPQQTWLDILKAVSQEARIDLMAVGHRVAGAMELPDGLYSLQRMLDFIHERNHQIHRNDESMQFGIEVLGARMIRIIDHSPYPADLQFGLILGLFERFMPLGANLRVHFDESVKRRSDGVDTKVFIVTW